MTISSINEIPESLHNDVQAFIESHPQWDNDRVVAAALSLFLLQQVRNEDRTISE